MEYVCVKLSGRRVWGGVGGGGVGVRGRRDMQGVKGCVMKDQRQGSIIRGTYGLFMRLLIACLAQYF